MKTLLTILTCYTLKTMKDDQLAEKQLALKTMKSLWPDVRQRKRQLIMLKLWFDLCKNSTQEEIDKIKEKVEKDLTI
jgi:hypothetical protein